MNADKIPLDPSFSLLTTTLETVSGFCNFLIYCNEDGGVNILYIKHLVSDHHTPLTWQLRSLSGPNVPPREKSSNVS